MILRPDQLAPQLERPLAPLWLLHGNEPLLVLEAAVVGEEKDERFAAEAEAVNGLNDAAQTLVQFIKEAGVFGAAGVAGHGGFSLVFGQQLRRGGEGYVDGVVGDLEEKGLVLVTLDELDGFAGEVCGGAFAAAGPGAAFGFLGGLPALQRGTVVLPAEMPFAEITGGVSCRAEAFGDGLDLQGQLQRHGRVAEFGEGALVAGDVLGDAEAGLVLPALEVAPRRRAHRPRVELSESHSLTRQAIQVWRFVEGVAVASDVGPAQIISEDQDHIGPFRHQ
mgnify:CR=1 FL=1